MGRRSLSPFLASTSRALADRNRHLADRAVNGPDEIHVCFDCRTVDFADPVSGRTVVFSVPGRQFCGPCWHWRQARLAEFDERTRKQLETVAAEF